MNLSKPSNVIIRSTIFLFGLCLTLGIWSLAYYVIGMSAFGAGSSKRFEIEIIFAYILGVIVPIGMLSAVYINVGIMKATMLIYKLSLFIVSILMLWALVGEPDNLILLTPPFIYLIIWLIFFNKTKPHLDRLNEKYRIEKENKTSLANFEKAKRHLNKPMVVEEFCEKHNLSKQNIDKLISRGKVKAFEIGKKLFIDDSTYNNT